MFDPRRIRRSALQVSGGAKIRLCTFYALLPRGLFLLEVFLSNVIDKQRLAYRTLRGRRRFELLAAFTGGFLIAQQKDYLRNHLFPLAIVRGLNSRSSRIWGHCHRNLTTRTGG